MFSLMVDSTNFEIKRLKPKLYMNIVEKPEYRVHRLTDTPFSHKRRLSLPNGEQLFSNLSVLAISANLSELSTRGR